mgnify:CR=1 FL=1
MNVLAARAHRGARAAREQAAERAHHARHRHRRGRGHHHGRGRRGRPGPRRRADPEPRLEPASSSVPGTVNHGGVRARARAPGRRSPRTTPGRDQPRYPARRGRRPRPCAATPRSSTATSTGPPASRVSPRSTSEPATGRSIAGRLADAGGGRRRAPRSRCSGQTAAQNLFGDADPLGQVIRIKKVPFTVDRAARSQGPDDSWGQDQDDSILIPLSTAKTKVAGRSQANARAVGTISRQDPDAAST